MGVDGENADGDALADAEVFRLAAARKPE